MFIVYAFIGVIIGFLACWLFVVRKDRIQAQLYPISLTKVESKSDDINRLDISRESSVRIDEMILGDEDSYHIKLRPIKTTRKLTTTPISLPTTAVAGITSILQHAPKVVVAGVNFANAGKIVLQFSPEMTARLAGGSAELVKAVGGGYRAIAKSVGAVRFEESARIVNVVNPAMVSVGIWQILAIVTAQKFLSDIDNRLALIEQGIAAIRSWLEDQTLSSMEANLKYMNRMYHSLESFEIKESDYRVFSSQLESIDRESRATTCLLRRTFGRAKDKFLAVPMQGKGLKDHTERAISALHECGKYGNALLLSESVRYVSSSLRAALDLSREHALAMLEETRCNVIDHVEGLKSFDKEARARICKLEGAISRRTKNYTCKRRVRSVLQEDVWSLIQPADEITQAIEKVITTTKEQLSSKPIRLLVERESDGSVSKISKVL